MNNIDIKELMLHKPPMLFVDEVLSLNKTSVTTSFTIKEDNIFLDTNSKKLSQTAFAEIMAQAVAAKDAYESYQNKQPQKKGFLVMLKNITYQADAFLSETLTCYANITDLIAQTYIAKCKITKGNVLVAQGEIRIYSLN